MFHLPRNTVLPPDVGSAALYSDTAATCMRLWPSVCDQLIDGGRSTRPDHAVDGDGRSFPSELAPTVFNLASRNSASCPPRHKSWAV